MSDTKTFASPADLDETDLRAYQYALQECGHYGGALDGKWGPRTRGARINYRAKALAEQDRRKREPEQRRAATESAGGPPSPDYAAMCVYYGTPGDESNLEAMPLPYPMFIAWDIDGNKIIREPSQAVESIRVHRRIAAPLHAALEDWLNEYGIEGLERHGLDLYGGCFNNRTVRGGRSTSKHAWGAAIDIDPARNGNHTPWRADCVGVNGFAWMPERAIQIMEAHGFLSGARAWGRDAMHFQYTRAK